jgi:hypothetical protein
VLDGLTEVQANRLSDYLKTRDDGFWKLLGAKGSGKKKPQTKKR